MEFSIFAIIRYFGGDIGWKTHRVPRRNLGAHRKTRNEQRSRPAAQCVGDLHLNLLHLRVESETQESAISEERSDTSITEKTPNIYNSFLVFVGFGSAAQPVMLSLNKSLNHPSDQ